MPNNNHETLNHHHVAAATNHPSPTPPKPNPKLLSIFLKFTVMSLILSLFLLFLGLAAILLIHLLLGGSFLHRRRQRLISPPRAAVSIHDIHNQLPPFQYTGTTGSDDCSICLECFKEGEICRVLPVCDHVFHAKCVDTWLMKVPNCPICRTRVRLESGGASDSGIGDESHKFLWVIGAGR